MKISAQLRIRGVTYNLTEYAFEHPGGEDILQELYGKDATKEFDDIGHSIEAHNRMREYATDNAVVISEIPIPRAPRKTMCTWLRYLANYLKLI